MNLYFFSYTVIKSVRLSFVGVEVNFYRTKLFPYLESTNSYFINELVDIVLKILDISFGNGLRI